MAFAGIFKIWNVCHSRAWICYKNLLRACRISPTKPDSVKITVKINSACTYILKSSNRLLEYSKLGLKTRKKNELSLIRELWNNMSTFETNFKSCLSKTLKNDKNPTTLISNHYATNKEFIRQRPIHWKII